MDSNTLCWWEWAGVLRSHTDLCSMLGCDLSRLDLSQISSVFLFLSLSLYSLLHKDMSSVSSNMRFPCAGVYKQTGRQHLQGMSCIKVCVWFMTGPEMSVLYTSTHLRAFQIHTHSHTFLCFLFSAVHIEGKITHCCTLWVWAEAELAERHSEVPVLRWVMVIVVQVSNIVFNYPHFEGDLTQDCSWVFSTSMPHVFISSQHDELTCVLLLLPFTFLSHLAPYWLLYFSLFQPLCLPSSLSLAIEREEEDRASRVLKVKISK